MWIRRLWRRIRSLLSRTHDQDLRDELQLHLDLLSEEYAAQGIPPEEARARAQRDFDNITHIQETSHDLFSFRRLEQLLKDFSYAAREMKRSPWFTAVAVLSLATGIAAVTTTASVVDALVLRGLPVREPERLVAFSRGPASTWLPWRYGEFRQWAESPDAPFRVAAVYTLNDLERPLLPAKDGAARDTVRVSVVSGDYFGVLSTDGRRLAYTESAGADRDIWVFDATDRTTAPFLKTSYLEGGAQFSPDGRWIAYVSNESGRGEIYVQPYPGPGGKWQVSTDGGSEPMWNRNSRELFYRRADRMMVAPVSTTGGFSAGRPQMLFERRYASIQLPQTFAYYDVSPNGERFLMVKDTEPGVGAPISIILNWPGLLGSRTRTNTN